MENTSVVEMYGAIGDWCVPMPGCWELTAAILMQKFPGSVKLTCPEKQCHIMRRLENWKHEDLNNQGYTYSLESNQYMYDMQ